MNQHYFTSVPRLGNVALSRHAISRAKEFGLTDGKVHEILFKGEDTPDGLSTVLRDYQGYRLVVLMRPEPFRGSRLVKTIIKVQEQARAR